MIAIEVGYNDLGGYVVIAAHIVPDWTAAQAAADEDFAGIDAVRDSDWTQGPHRAGTGITFADGGKHWAHVRVPPPVALLNTSIATEDGTYKLRTVTADQARALIAGRELLSAIGHDATAQILTSLLGTDVPVNRIQFAQQPGQVALVFKLRGRAPEGAVLDLAQVEAIGYDLKILERVS